MPEYSVFKEMLIQLGLFCLEMSINIVLFSDSNWIVLIISYLYFYEQYFLYCNCRSI